MMIKVVVLLNEWMLTDEVMISGCSSWPRSSWMCVGICSVRVGDGMVSLAIVSLFVKVIFSAAGSVDKW